MTDGARPARTTASDCGAEVAGDAGWVGGEPEHAQLARVNETQLPAAVKEQDVVGEARSRRGGKMEEEGAGHAEVGDYRKGRRIRAGAVVQSQKEVLGASLHGADGASACTAEEVRGAAAADSAGPVEIGACDGAASNAFTQEVTSGGFDFREFRHTLNYLARRRRRTAAVSTARTRIRYQIRMRDTVV